MEARNEPLPISAMLRFEFTHGVRREVFRNVHDRTVGLPLGVAMGVITAFEEDFQLGRLVAVEVDLPSLMARAESVSEGHTTAQGNRAFDTLHVATALMLGFSEMLTFDEQQRTLAEAEGMTVPL